MGSIPRRVPEKAHGAATGHPPGHQEAGSNPPIPVSCWLKVAPTGELIYPHFWAVPSEQAPWYESPQVEQQAVAAPEWEAVSRLKLSTQLQVNSGGVGCGEGGPAIGAAASRLLGWERKGTWNHCFPFLYTCSWGQCASLRQTQQIFLEDYKGESVLSHQL